MGARGVLSRQTVRSLLAATALAGCSVDADLSKKRCPCAAGYSCDPVQNVCVPGPSCDPKVRVNDFQAAWSTTNTIRWRWEPDGEADDFVRYEMVVAQSLEDLLSRSGSARVFGPDLNPELGSLLLPRTDGTEDYVRGTGTDELEPNTSYVGQLLVVDTELCAFSTDIVGKGTTPELPAEVLIFRDDPPPGYAAPDSFGPVDDSQGSGRHLEFRPGEDPECVASGDATCGQPLRYQDMNLDLGRISAGQFDTAFLEFLIASDASIPSYYSLTWLWFDDCNQAQFRYVPYAIRSTDEYQRIQIPLAVFPQDGSDRLLTHADLETDAQGTPLCGFAIGGAWQLGATIRIDELRIRF